MTERRLPAHIEALARGPGDANALEQLRDYFLGEKPMPPERADELFLLAECMGEGAAPELATFVSEALAAFLTADLDPTQ